MKRDFSDLDAGAVLDLMARADRSERRAIARSILYRTHSRPTERAEQKRLFLGLVRSDIELDRNDAMNALAAASHKCLELDDTDSMLWLLPRLDPAIATADTLPWHAPIRNNRVHVGFSLRYVRLLGALHRDAASFDDAAGETLRYAAALPREKLCNSFFRSAANVVKSLGLVAVRAGRRTDLDTAEAATRVIRATLESAVEVRALRDGPFPLSNFIAPGRLRQGGPVSGLAMQNEFKEFHRANRILMNLQDMLETDGGAPRADAASRALLLSLPTAYPGERDALLRRFDALVPAPGA